MTEKPVPAGSLKSITPHGERETRYVEIDTLSVKAQVRKHFNPEQMQELSESVREKGILQPLTVRTVGPNRYQIISGERRWRAARAAGLKQLPVHIITVNDEELRELQIIENLQRKDLNSFERVESLLEMYAVKHSMLTDEARKHLRRLRKKKLEMPEEAEDARMFFLRFGVHFESFVSADLRILRFTEDVKALVRERGMDISSAREIAKIEDDTLRVRIGELALQEGWKFRQVVAEVAKYIARRQAPEPRAKVGADENFQDRIGRLPQSKKALAQRLYDQLMAVIGA